MIFHFVYYVITNWNWSLTIIENQSCDIFNLKLIIHWFTLALVVVQNFARWARWIGTAGLFWALAAEQVNNLIRSARYSRTITQTFVAVECQTSSARGNATERTWATTSHACYKFVIHLDDFVCVRLNHRNI